MTLNEPLKVGQPGDEVTPPPTRPTPPRPAQPPKPTQQELLASIDGHLATIAAALTRIADKVNPDYSDPWKQGQP